MTTAKGYHSEISGAIHEMMSKAHSVSVVSREMLRAFEPVHPITCGFNEAPAIEA